MADSLVEDQGGPQSNGPAGEYSSFQWILAWLILLIFLALFNKTRIGHLVLYYALVLMILFVVLTNASWFASILAPLRSLGPGLSTNGPSEESYPGVSKDNEEQGTGISAS